MQRSNASARYIVMKLAKRFLIYPSNFHDKTVISWICLHTESNKENVIKLWNTFQCDIWNMNLTIRSRRNDMNVSDEQRFVVTLAKNKGMSCAPRRARATSACDERNHRSNKQAKNVALSINNDALSNNTQALLLWEGIDFRNKQVHTFLYILCKCCLRITKILD